MKKEESLYLPHQRNRDLGSHCITHCEDGEKSENHEKANVPPLQWVQGAGTQCLWTEGEWRARWEVAIAAVHYSARKEMGQESERQQN